MTSIESLLGMIATEASEASLEAKAHSQSLESDFLEQLEHWSGRHPNCRDCEYSILSEEDAKRIRARIGKNKIGGKA